MVGFNMASARRLHHGFSLVELVIVVVIIAIIAAIAIPRMSRGAAGAADAKLIGDLATMRRAIEIYAAEHGGVYPTVDGLPIVMIQYSDVTGVVAQSTRDAICYLGPYLREIPALSVGANKGKTGISDVAGNNVGWIYNQNTGQIRANATESDVSGKAYSTY
jgi:prepilin-type N-terminal cleavage/methylation domain-containing protein